MHYIVAVLNLEENIQAIFATPFNIQLKASSERNMSISHSISARKSTHASKKIEQKSCKN